MHESTFNYLEPTDQQKELLGAVRGAAMEYAFKIDALLPDGPDKTYLMRKFREVAMWANITVTRQPDGAPRA